MGTAAGRLSSRTAGALRAHAAAQRVHEVDDLGRLALFGRFDLLARALLLQQLLQRIFIVIFEFFRIEMPGLGRDDVGRDLQHVLGNFFVPDIVEVLVLLSNLIRESQREPEQAFAARLDLDDVHARGENDSAERHHAFLADRVADDREGLLADLPIGHHVVWVVQIEVVDLLPRHELVDLDRARALYGDGLEFLGFELDVFALADFVAFDDVGRVDFLLGLRVHFAVSDAVAGVLVDLMKPDFFALAARGKECDRTRAEREFQVAFPIRARGHGGTPIATRINESESYPVPATPWRRLPPWQVCVADLFSPALPVKLHCRGDSSRSNPWLLPPLNQGPRSGPSTPLCTSRAWSNGASKRCPPSTRTSCSLPALATAARSASASTSRSSRSKSNRRICADGTADVRRAFFRHEFPSRHRSDRQSGARSPVAERPTHALRGR